MTTAGNTDSPPMSPSIVSPLPATYRYDIRLVGQLVDMGCSVDGFCAPEGISLGELGGEFDDGDKCAAFAGDGRGA